MNSLHLGAMDLYGKGVHFAKKYLSPTNLDRIEAVGSALVPSILGFLAPSFVMNGGIDKSCVQIGFGLLGAVAGEYSYHRFLKAPFVEKEIQGIVKKSQGKSQSALMIHTTQDHNGAFSSFHSLAEIYERCARNHSIDRIRGLTYEERMKVQGNKYDVIGLMAHGSPRFVNVDGDLFGLNIYREKQLRFFKNRIKDGGIIFLDSCSTASGERSIAETISSHAREARIFGSTHTIWAVGGADYTDDMIPTYYRGGPIPCFRGENTTRVFQAGEEVKLPEISNLFV